MDVGAPSNFERLRALYANDAALRADLSAERVDDDQIRDAISTSRARYGVIVCPHTACALVALERRRAAGVASDYAVVGSHRKRHVLGKALQCRGYSGSGAIINYINTEVAT